jgi:hypothetical protein
VAACAGFRKIRYVAKRIGDRGRKCIVRRYVENKVDTRRLRDERAGQGGWLGTTSATEKRSYLTWLSMMLEKVLRANQIAYINCSPCTPSRRLFCTLSTLDHTQNYTVHALRSVQRLSRWVCAVIRGVQSLRSSLVFLRGRYASSERSDWL